jgi:hypothetical protein
MRRRRRSRWKKMREDHWQLLQQHLQQSKITVQIISVGEVANVYPDPDQGNTHVAVDLAGGDATVNKVTELLLFCSVLIRFSQLFYRSVKMLVLKIKVNTPNREQIVQF